MSTQSFPGDKDPEHGNGGGNDEIPLATAQGRNVFRVLHGLGSQESRGHNLEAQQGSTTAISSTYFSPVGLDIDIWGNLVCHLPCFAKKNSKYCLKTKDGTAVVQRFDAIQDVLEFMLKHGIPKQTKPLSKEIEIHLSKTISEVHVPKKELRKAINSRPDTTVPGLKIPSIAEIIPILKSSGFEFATSNGGTLKLLQEPQDQGFNRIYIPKSLEVAGESPPSYGICGVHYFETLEDLREYIRGTEQLEFVSDLTRTRRHKQDEDNPQLLMRIWGATSPRPLPIFDWNQLEDDTNKYKKGLNKREGQAHSSKKVSQSPAPKKLAPTEQANTCIDAATSAKSTPGLLTVGGSASKVSKAIANASSSNAAHQDLARAARPEKRSNASEAPSSTDAKRPKIAQTTSSSTMGNCEDESMTGQLSIHQLEAQLEAIECEEQRMKKKNLLKKWYSLKQDVKELKEELGKEAGTEKCCFKALKVDERRRLIENFEEEKEALSREVKERNASGARWLDLKDKTQKLLTGTATEMPSSFSKITLETMQAREKVATEEYALRVTQHKQLLDKIERAKKRLEIEASKEE